MTEPFDPRAITDPAQIRLLASPIRQEIVDTLAAVGGTASAAALAEELGRPADGLYYHLRALVRGGLLIEAGPEGRNERLYRLAGDDAEPLRLAYRTGALGNATELRAFARSLLQIAGRDFEAALEDEQVTVDGPMRELWASRNKGWLSDADIAEVNQLLERISKVTSQPRAPGRTRLASCAFVLAPISPQPKRRQSTTV